MGISTMSTLNRHIRLTREARVYLVGATIIASLFVLLGRPGDLWPAVSFDPFDRRLLTQALVGAGDKIKELKIEITEETTVTLEPRASCPDKSDQDKFCYVVVVATPGGPRSTPVSEKFIVSSRIQP